TFSALWFFFRTYFRLSRTAAALAAASFYAAWIASLNSPEEQIFWLTGAIEYHLSFATLLALLSLLYKKRSAVWYYLVVVALSVAIPAQHEIAGTFLCVALLAAIVCLSFLRLPAGQWYVSLIFTLLSQAFVMATPGNKLRAAQEHRHLWDFA